MTSSRANGILLVLLSSFSSILVSAGTDFTAESKRKGPPGEKTIVRVDSLSIDQMLHDNLNQGEAYIWYLFHSGFAVKTKSKMLIFDYVDTCLYPPDTVAVVSLSAGFINPEEISDQNVYVFVSHAHPDHYDPSIMDWREKIKNITYLFGWQAAEDTSHHYFVGRRTMRVVDGMEIYTINSHHGGIPEVAYLVKVDGLTLYHSGDCRDDYIREMAYLKGIADSVDIAFQYDLDLDEPINDFVIHPLLTLQPAVTFPMHFGAEEYKYKKSADRWRAHGYRGLCVCAERRGDAFWYRENR